MKHPYFDVSNIQQLMSFANAIENRDYTLQELAYIECDGSILACFEGFEMVPATNVVCVLCLALCVDVWSPEHCEPEFRYLASRARRRLNELKQEMKDEWPKENAPF